MGDSDLIPETLTSPRSVADFSCAALMEAIIPPGLVPLPIQCPQRSRSHYRRLKELSHNHPLPLGSNWASRT
jgi:hypothetical protein